MLELAIRGLDTGRLAGASYTYSDLVGRNCWITRPGRIAAGCASNNPHEEQSMSRFRRFGAGIALTLIVSLSILPVVSAQDATPDAPPAPVALDDLQLQAIKDYLVEHIDKIVAG